MTGDFAAYGQGFVRQGGGFSRGFAQHPQKPGLKVGIGKFIFVLQTVDGVTVLQQVVGPHRNEIHLFQEAVQRQVYRRHFQHHADAVITAERNFVTLKLAHHIIQDQFHIPDLFQRRDHRKQDFQPSVFARPQNRPQVCLKKFGILQQDTGPARPQRRVYRTRDIQAVDLLVRTGVQHPDGDFAVGRAEHFVVDVVLDIFVRQVITQHEHEFGTVESDAVRMIFFQQRRFAEQ